MVIKEVIVGEIPIPQYEPRFRQKRSVLLEEPDATRFQIGDLYALTGGQKVKIPAFFKETDLFTIESLGKYSAELLTSSGLVVVYDYRYICPHYMSKAQHEARLKKRYLSVPLSTSTVWKSKINETVVVLMHADSNNVQVRQTGSFFNMHLTKEVFLNNYKELKKLGNEN